MNARFFAAICSFCDTVPLSVMPKGDEPFYLHFRGLCRVSLSGCQFFPSLSLLLLFRIGYSIHWNVVRIFWLLGTIEAQTE